MEALTKKTVAIEFEGKKYALQDQMTIADFLADLGLPKDMTVSLKITKDGFVMVRV
jgi:sulfur carrier protein ThiS